MPRYTLTTDTALTDNQQAQILALFPDWSAKIVPEKQTLHIIGRRWFQKTYGNTYHTAEVLINGKSVYKSMRSYGYGDQYLTTAVEWLQRVDLLPSDIVGHVGTRYLREESGYEFSYEVHDVARQRDL